jgi:two-component sensor histidine kinase
VEARRPGEPLAQLWTSGGRLIVASHMDFAPDGSSLPQPPPFTQAPKGPAGSLSRGPRDILAFATAESGALVATVRLPREEVLAPWRKDARDSLILLALGGLVLMVLASIAARYADQDYRARLELEQSAAALSAALGEKDILLREIHHRVKNNLQITSSLIQLQSRSFQDPAVRAAFDQTQQRLRSISLVHDVLYHENTAARVDAAVYLRELTEEIATANGAEERGISVEVDAESIVLSPGQVTPLGLCLAEVLTNAFKHAFPEGRAGSILVRAREAGGEIELLVRDDGEGFEGEPDRKGSLGLMLISVLARQIGGAFSFSSEGGTLFRLAFPRKG